MTSIIAQPPEDQTSNVTDATAATHSACPPWCATDHATHDKFDTYVRDDFTVYELRHHSFTVAEFPNPGAGVDRKVAVMISITDDLDEGARLPAVVTVDGAECLSPELAVEVAHAVGKAARLLGYDPDGAR